MHSYVVVRVRRLEVRVMKTVMSTVDNNMSDPFPFKNAVLQVLFKSHIETSELFK